MNLHLSPLALATLAIAGSFFAVSPAEAQVAGGTTTVQATITESTTPAMGWSVKKTLLGKALYNETGQKIGKVEDLIVSPDRNVSYVIVGAGGLIGIGRHDVALPVSKIEVQGERLVMVGATKDSIKVMPHFAYAVDTRQRDAFVAAADKDIAKGKEAVASLEQKAGAAAADAKTRIALDIDALQKDVKSAEARLSEMKHATAARWKQYEVDVSAATARLRKSTEKAQG